MSQTVVASAFIYLAMHSVMCYENAYDILERRNRRFHEPRYFHSTTFYDDRNGFFTSSRNPHTGFSNFNPHFTRFGNGYDNLGNGIPTGNFRSLRQQLIRNWPFERQPYRQTSNYDFESYPTFRMSHQNYIDHHSGGYYPTGHTPILSGIYDSEFSLRRNADVTKADRFIENNEGQKNAKSDGFYQRTLEGVNTDFSKNEKAGEQLHADQTGENKSSLRSNKVVKKGRTTKGFAVHHHKDETGNSTTFFDETSNFGGQSDLRDIADGFGSRKTLEQISHKGDEKHFTESEGQTSNYGSGHLVGNHKLEQDFTSLDDHQKLEKKYTTGNEKDDTGFRKTYQYLNGDRFDYTEPHVDYY